MDLIDRKDLLKRMNIISNTADWYSEMMDGFECGIGMIEDTPTVDAIPIEWINNYLEKAFDNDDERKDIIVMCYMWNLERGKEYANVCQ